MGRNTAANRQRIRRLLAKGYTEKEARRKVAQDGSRAREIQKQRAMADAKEEKRIKNEMQQARAEQRRREDALYARQPEEPRSVRAIPAGGFETNRSRH